MSQQLQEVMQTRRQLTTLDERNRLARDLHDRWSDRKPAPTTCRLLISSVDVMLP